MRTLKLVLSYEGTAYHGWQLQPNGVTVQQVVEEAIGKILGPHRTSVAGRTDTGVHALAQVASFRTGKEMGVDELQRAMNFHLPLDVTVLSIEDVPNEFNPRNAISKTYRYRVYNDFVRPAINRNYVWQVWNVDWDKFEEASRKFVGEHDFSSFRDAHCAATHAVRNITRLNIDRNPPAPKETWIEFEGNGFLKHMVRNLVGSLMQVGRGLKPVSWIDDVIAARDRRKAGPTAPPSGLFLVRVVYGERQT